MATNTINLNSNEFLKWRDLLLKRKTDLVNFEKSVVNRALSELSIEETGEISKARLHPADLASTTQDIETINTLSEKNILAVQEIESALNRLEKGSFGICQSCGSKIEKKRLEILPETRHCLECRELYEIQRR